MNFKKFVLVFLLVILFGLLQSTNLVMIAGVKPNLLLVLLIALAFFVEDIWTYGFFILLAGGLLKTQGFFTPDLVVFTVLVMASAWAANTWHALPAANNLILAGAATALFYLLTGPLYIVSNFSAFGIELVCNLVLAFILYQVFDSLCLKENSMLRT